MLACFEHWFGPYPWYGTATSSSRRRTSAWSIRAPSPTAITIKNGYLGRDLSGTGWGLKWDFIIVHESAHEWWGQQSHGEGPRRHVGARELRELRRGAVHRVPGRKGGGRAYVIGTRKQIRNDEPIVGHYGVNAEGSGDMYYKGGNMLHTIRQIVNDDEKWRGILRGLQKTFRHQVVTGKQVEGYISARAGIDLSKVFDEYLTTTMIPTLEYRINGTELSYRWSNVVPGFAMPVKVSLTDGAMSFIRPTGTWKTATLHLKSPETFHVDENFYVNTRDVNKPVSPQSP